MKKLLATLTLIPLFILAVSTYPATAGPEEGIAVAPGNLDTGTSRLILEATIYLVAYPKRGSAASNNRGSPPQTSGVKGTLIERARGIGSVVTYRGHVLIVTHDHWRWRAAELDRIELRDAQDNLLLALKAEAFERLIRYRDGGTLILEAPGLLFSSGVTPAGLDHAATLAPGRTVYVAHRRQADRRPIDLQPMTVDSIDDDDGRPVLYLRGSGGQALAGGDSGGGVWVDGRLAGNIWKVVTVETTVRETYFWGAREFVAAPAHRGVAARFPLDDGGLALALEMGAPSDSTEH